MKPEEVEMDSSSGRISRALFMWGTTALAILEACQNLALTVHVATSSRTPTRVRFANRARAGEM